MARITHLTVASTMLLAALTGCQKEPACKQGQLAAEWQQPPLSHLVPKEATVCEVPAAEATAHAQFWKPVKVHRANMDSVDAAQNNGWKRSQDNWYGTKGDFNTPKWSEFLGPDGALRIDVKEAGDGALIDVRFKPKQPG